MKEYDLGKEGEEKARLFLKRQGFQIQSPDWIGYKGTHWTCFEIKRKERFAPPPFEGHGLDKSQVFLRKKFCEETHIRTMLIIFEIPSDRIFYNYLDILENETKFETKNGIIVYPLANFLEWTDVSVL